MQSRQLISPSPIAQETTDPVARIALKIRQSLDLTEILQSTADEVRKLLATDRVILYRFLKNGTSGEVVVESVGSPWQPLQGRTIPDPCFESAWYDQFHEGLAAAIDDVGRSDLPPTYRELLTELQAQANLVVPILYRRKLWGLLIIHHCAGPRNWPDDEVQLLHRLAVQIGIAVQQAKLYQSLRHRSRELEQANQRMSQALGRERELSTLKTNFIVTVSHEFRTPLTAIQSSSDLLANFPCSEGDEQLLLGQIDQAVQQMVQLLEGVLTWQGDNSTDDFTQDFTDDFTESLTKGRREDAPGKDPIREKEPTSTSPNHSPGEQY
jgi:transcriptional regulator with GAF, ATPase, and Fis domain